MFFGGSQCNLDKKNVVEILVTMSRNVFTREVSPGVTSAAAVVAKVN